MNTDTERARFEAAKAKALAGIDYAMNWRNNSPSAVEFATGLADARQFVIDAALPSAPSEGPSDKEMLDWLERWVLSIARLTSPDMSGIRFAGQAYNPAKERGEAGSSYIPLRGQTIRDLARAAIKASTP
jgi:hypothetical protein